MAFLIDEVEDVESLHSTQTTIAKSRSTAANDELPYIVLVVALSHGLSHSLFMQKLVNTPSIIKYLQLTKSDMDYATAWVQVRGRRELQLLRKPYSTRDPIGKLIVAQLH